jgi:cytidine deaminase
MAKRSHCDKTDVRHLIEAAKEARSRAYAPYSRFRVGAALLASDGRIYTGCNVENASFGLSLCAERNAVARAVADGRRQFSAIAIYAGTDQPVSPCGACRQVLAEFNPRMMVIMASRGGAFRAVGLERLLPRSFGRKQMKNKT